MTPTRLIALLIAASLSAAACTTDTNASGQRAEPEVTPSVSLDAADSPPPSSPTADVVEDVLPSVVNVRVTSLQSDIFGGPQETEGQGSGVIIDPSGIILTNNHVVQCAVDVEVVFTDEHARIEGEVVGTAPEKDLAVIKVDTEDLDAIELGNSSELRLGDEVLALGFPLGLGGPTVTRGIVSGKDRIVEPSGPSGVQQLDGLLQTDAAINPGNSGGALVDAAGRLVGINTAAASASAAENIGFAIPIDSALPVVREITEKPAEERAWLGVQIDSVDSSAVAAQLGLDEDVRGAVILRFLEGPAEAAGFEEGDVITAIEGEEIRSSEDLSKVLADFAAGDRVEVDVVRQDGTETIEVTLGQRPAAC